MEFFIEIIFARIIVRFFGYYTLWIFFKFTRNYKSIELLDKSISENVGTNLLVGIVGLTSFSAFFFLLIYFLDFIDLI